MDIDDDEVKLMVAVVSIVGIMMTVVLLLENLEPTGMSIAPVQGNLIISTLFSIIVMFSLALLIFSGRIQSWFSRASS